MAKPKLPIAWRRRSVSGSGRFGWSVLPDGRFLLESNGRLSVVVPRSSGTRVDESSDPLTWRSKPCQS